MLCLELMTIELLGQSNELGQLKETFSTHNKFKLFIHYLLLIHYKHLYSASSSGATQRLL